MHRVRNRPATVRVALGGVGNCASSLVQGVVSARENEVPGLLHPVLGGLRLADITFSAAFDVDARKVGCDLADAIAAPPNCTTIWVDVPPLGVSVQMAPPLDGVGALASSLVQVDAQKAPTDVSTVLRETQTDVLVNLLPVGAVEATKFFAQAALEAGVAFVNGTPTPIATDVAWVRRFDQARLPLLGDDVKSQLGGTALHRALLEFCRYRGASVDRTYQLNFGGNTDFLNMQEPERKRAKRATKNQALRSLLGSETAAVVGPAEYVEFLQDRKVAYLRIEGELFLGMPFDIEVRLSVEDSPNAAGILVDAIRAAVCARTLGHGGAIVPACAYLFKHPPEEMDDREALSALRAFCSSLSPQDFD